MIDEKLISELDRIIEPGPLFAELGKRFPGRVAIGTAGQLSGAAMIDMAVKAKGHIRVFTIDTHRLFPETYELFTKLEAHYGITVERFLPPEDKLQAMVKQHGEYLFFDSKEKQEYCCFVRKVLPNQKALDTLDVWITGLRADQSKSRADLSRFQIIQHDTGSGTRPILKVAPLVNWDEKRVREYLDTHHVPRHELLELKLPGDYYYESLGCILCTTPIGPYEPRRAGRWRWFNGLDGLKECGLHLPSQPDKDK